jgi:hypothetical protein
VPAEVDVGERHTSKGPPPEIRLEERDIEEFVIEKVHPTRLKLLMSMTEQPPFRRSRRCAPWGIVMVEFDEKFPTNAA